MGQTADDVRRDIERTRAEMSGTIDAIGDRVSPRRIMERRTDRVRHGFRNMREAVMGTADATTGRMSGAASTVGSGVTGAASSMGSGVTGAASSMGSGVTGMASAMGSGVADAAGSAVDTVREAPEMMRRQAQGNPLAAGLVAFGGGLLLASVLPSTRREQQAASSVMPALEPVREQAISAAQDVKQQMTGVAGEAMGSVRETVAQAGDQVMEQASTAASEIRDQAAHAGEQVKEQASTAAGEVASKAEQGVETVRSQTS